MLAAAFFVGHIVKHNASFGIEPHLLEKFYRHQSCAVAAFHVAGAAAINKSVFDLAGPGIVAGVLRFCGREHVHMPVKQKRFSLLSSFPFRDEIGSVFLIFISVHLDTQLIQPFFHSQRHWQFAARRTGRLDCFYQTLKCFFFTVGHLFFDLLNCDHNFSSFTC